MAVRVFVSPTLQNDDACEVQDVAACVLQLPSCLNDIPQFQAVPQIMHLIFREDRPCLNQYLDATSVASLLQIKKHLQKGKAWLTVRCSMK